VVCSAFLKGRMRMLAGIIMMPILYPVNSSGYYALICKPTCELSESNRHDH